MQETSVRFGSDPQAELQGQKWVLLSGLDAKSKVEKEPRRIGKLGWGVAGWRMDTAVTNLGHGDLPAQAGGREQLVSVVGLI